MNNRSPLKTPVRLGSLSLCVLLAACGGGGGGGGSGQGGSTSPVATSGAAPTPSLSISTECSVSTDCLIASADGSYNLNSSNSSSNARILLSNPGSTPLQASITLNGADNRSISYVYSSTNNSYISASLSPQINASLQAAPGIQQAPYQRGEVLGKPDAGIGSLWQSARLLSAAAGQVGDTRNWYPNSKSANVIAAKLQSQQPLSSGGNVNVWVNTSYTMSQAQTDAIAKAFAQSGSGIHDQVRNLTGATEWGSRADNFGSVLIPGSTKDIDIVFDNLNPGGGSIQTLGYFDSGNNLVNPCTNGCLSTNRALAFFMDINTMNTAPVTAFSTLAHEFQHMLHYYTKYLAVVPNADSSWLNEMNSMQVEDFMSGRMTALMTAAGYPGTPADDPSRYAGPSRVKEWLQQPDCSFNLKSSASLPSACVQDSYYKSLYPTGGALGAFINRQFGPNAMRTVLNSKLTDEAALEAAVGGDLPALIRRWQASLTLVAGDLDAKIGYPAYNQSGITLAAIDIGAMDHSKVPAAVNLKSKGKAAHVYRDTITVPAHATVTVAIGQ